MNVNEMIIEIIKTLSGQEDVKLTDDLQSNLGLDSLSMVTLLIEIEDVFGIELNEADMNPFDLKTVEDAVSLVGKYVGDYNEQKS